MNYYFLYFSPLHQLGQVHHVHLQIPRKQEVQVLLRVKKVMQKMTLSIDQVTVLKPTSYSLWELTWSLILDFSHFIGSPLDTLIPLKNHIFRDWEWFQLQKMFHWFSSVSQLTLSPFAPLKPFSPGAPVDPCTVHKSWKNYLVLPFKLSVTTILYSQKWICLELSFHVLFSVPIILLSFCSFLE